MTTDDRLDRIEQLIASQSDVIAAIASSVEQTNIRLDSIEQRLDHVDAQTVLHLREQAMSYEDNLEDFRREVREFKLEVRRFMIDMQHFKGRFEVHMRRIDRIADYLTHRMGADSAA